jgi:hypothetical protein
MMNDADTHYSHDESAGVTADLRRETAQEAASVAAKALRSMEISLVRIGKSKRYAVPQVRLRLRPSVPE